MRQAFGTVLVGVLIGSGLAVFFGVLSLANMLPFWLAAPLVLLGLGLILVSIYQWNGWESRVRWHRYLVLLLATLAVVPIAIVALPQMYRQQHVQAANPLPAPSPAQVVPPPATFNGTQSQQINGVTGPVTINNNPPASIPLPPREPKQKAPPPKPAPIIQQHSEGANSPNVIGNNNTFAYGPPDPFELKPAQQEQVKSILRQQADESIDIQCIGSGCKSLEGIVNTFAAAHWQISSAIRRLSLTVFGDLVVVDPGKGNHIFYKKEAHDAALLVQRALGSVSVKVDPLLWSETKSPSAILRDATEQLCLVIGEPK